jgi:hypothetical protein
MECGWPVSISYCQKREFFVEYQPVWSVGCFGFGSFLFTVFSSEKSPEYDFSVNRPLHNLYVSVMAVAQLII